MPATPDANAYAAEIEAFREEKNQFFRRDENSPLSPEQQASFPGLAYFPPDARFRFTLPVEPGDGATVEFDTSTGRKVKYHRWGRVRFDVQGRTAELTLYRAEHGHSLFVPFRDATSGKETYGGGRYLDVELPPGGKPVELDFNLAYNPYCAYSDQWTCPLPPGENWLAVRIEAGERVYPGAH